MAMGWIFGWCKCVCSHKLSPTSIRLHQEKMLPCLQQGPSIAMQWHDMLIYLHPEITGWAAVTAERKHPRGQPAVLGRAPAEKREGYGQGWHWEGAETLSCRTLHAHHGCLKAEQIPCSEKKKKNKINPSSPNHWGLLLKDSSCAKSAGDTSSHGASARTNKAVGWRFADNRKWMSAFKKKKKKKSNQVYAQMTHIPALTHLSGKRWDRRVLTVFSTVTKGVVTLQLATATWAGVPALSSAALGTQRHICTLCQHVQLHHAARKLEATFMQMLSWCSHTTLTLPSLSQRVRVIIQSQPPLLPANYSPVLKYWPDCY